MSDTPQEGSAAEIQKVAESSPQIAKEVAEFSKQLEETHFPTPVMSDTPDGIAILGSHPATKMQAPFDQNWLIYACSPHNLEPGHPRLPRWDEWFEVHVPVTHPTRSLAYLEEVKKEKVVWMRDKEAMPYFKGARAYPEEELADRFGPFFWTSSIAFIMAKAIVECEKQGIPRIGLWGIMQASPTEYQYQRPGIQYFIQKAMDAGIEVVAPRESGLFDPQNVEF